MVSFIFMHVYVRVCARVHACARMSVCVHMHMQCVRARPCVFFNLWVKKN